MNRLALASLNACLFLAYLFSTPINAAHNDPEWSDAGGWADLTNYSTIQAVSAGDDLFLLARGNSGMTTLRYDHVADTWEAVASNDPAWSDAEGWADLSNYSTIQAVSAGKQLYLLARSNSGMITLRYNRTTDRWDKVASNDPLWSDAIDWKDLSNFSTIQAVGVGDDLYLLARADSGMTTLRYDRDTDRWREVASNDPKWSDAAGWDDESNSATIQAVSAGNELYLLARANSGMITLRYNRAADRWEAIASNDPAWSDANGWADLSNYSTIQAVGAENKLCLLARGNSGMMTLRYERETDRWETVASNNPKWSDSAGWDDFTNYSTIQAVSDGNELYMLARANSGMTTLRYDRDTNQWETIASNDPKWSDAVGWNEFSNYSTIQAVGAKGKLFLLARDNGGMSTRLYDSASDQWTGATRVISKALSTQIQTD